MKKRSIADLGKNAAPVTNEMRIAGQLALKASLQKMKDDFALYQAAPKSKAWDKMQGALVALRSDPEINVSEPCRDLLDMVAELLDQAWPHHPIEDIVQPLQKHFDGVKSKDATNKKNEILEKKRKMHHNFLDMQEDISDTVRLATRLRKAFGIKTVRGSENTVRLWKKLRSAGKT